jgi:hypothetical protein
MPFGLAVGGGHNGLVGATYAPGHDAVSAIVEDWGGRLPEAAAAFSRRP